MGYIRDSSVAIVTYDITNKVSFDIIIMVVGNKIDLNDNRQITKNQGQEKANKLGALFMETSAKSGSNIKELFTKIAANLPDHKQQNEIINEVIIDSEPTEQPASACL